MSNVKLVVEENGYKNLYSECSIEEAIAIVRSFDGGFSFFIKEDGKPMIPAELILLKEDGYNYAVKKEYSFNRRTSSYEGLTTTNPIETLADAAKAVEAHYHVSVSTGSWERLAEESQFNGSYTFERWNGPSSCYYYTIIKL